MKKILLVLGTILCLYAIAFVFCFPKNQGAYFLGFIGLVLLLYAVTRKKILSKSQKGVWKLLRRMVTFGFCFMLITFAVFCVSVIGISSHVPENGKDAVIVLGAGLRGNTVSVILAERLDRAVEYYEENKGTLLVVSGGQGGDESVSEAFAMRAYLLSKGVNDENILMEDKSVSTGENFRFSKAVLDNYFGDKAYTSAYVTNDFHCYRAGKYAAFAGLKTDFIPAETPLFMWPACCARDYLGVAYVTVFGR